MVRRQLYIFSHRIVHLVYNYMFRPCILVTVRSYSKLYNQLYNMCVGYCGGERDLVFVRRDLVPPSPPPEYPMHIFYSCWLSYSTTWRWPIYRAETCSCITNVLFYVKKYIVVF